MSVPSTLASILEIVDIAADKREEAEACLSEFVALGEEAKKAARPATIKKVFPLAFGEIAAIETSANFEDLKQSPWSTNCYLSPATIVTPFTAQQVSKILLLIRFLGAKFSVRGGGHLHNPGFTSNDGGVVISMTKFTQCTLSEDKKTAHIGPGLTWLDVYKALDPMGIAVTGGRVPSVGVPGLLLGGGLSFQNSKHGFSCMGIANYEIVLADGKIVNANPKENTDLFWALKGGCANFGIVTKVEMTTVPNKVWAEARLYSPTQNGELLDALMLYHEACEKDPNATLIWQSVNQATLLVFFYCAPVENPDVFKCFYDIPFMINVLPPALTTVYGVVQGLANVLSADILLHEMRTMSSLPDLDMYKAVEACRIEQIEVLKNVEGIILTMVIQPIASNAINASNANGGNPMGLIAQNHQWFLVMADWKNAKDEELVRKSVRKILDTAEEVSKKNGTYLPFVYSNYASRDQDPLVSYGTENLQKLKDIAKKYDADSVFQNLQNGGWLVSKSGMPDMSSLKI
ncbi:6-hydroxy-D-nicotine oxidase [Lepidopterella palustris CBS 459.81]|uniref:6-hydroxy-D-nicotine oxidase n=1 Tax=Lepidopterella palustris CBS 459.81 TaxID=1314670 RepID=A0A8E2DYA9_9PEZI|nr:6-hydroxy-D-nicotine oxidase [Lepidopterella palustris CBS 459.81]